jgi:drug/metabolite transporter (DMT)-like permease
MTLTAFLLILCSTVLHAWWNYRGKKHQPSAAFFLLADGSVALLMCPFLLYYHAQLTQLPPKFWLLIFATGFFEALYYTGLAYAYRKGELSTAYPLVRALPVLLVPLVNQLAGHPHPLNTAALVGFAVVALGCLLLPLPSFTAFTLNRFWNAATAFAVLAGIGVTGYTLIDYNTVQLLRGGNTAHFGPSELVLVLIPLLTLSTVFWLGLYTALRGEERAEVRSLWNSSRAYVGVTGVVIWISYGLVLIAMNFVTDVSYVSAFRSLSIPLGALLGVLWLREPSCVPKWVGVGAVSCGLILVKLA